MKNDELDTIAIFRMAGEELDRRGWTLANEPGLLPPGEAFFQRVCQYVQMHHTEKQRALNESLVREAAVHEYCCLLHSAVSKNGSHHQEIALEETIRYGWPIALRKCPRPEMAENAVLRAATQLWHHIKKCEPGSYLAYFAQILLNECRMEMRKERRIDRHEAPLDDESDAEPWRPPTDMLDAGASDPALAHADPYRHVLVAASRDSLHKLLRECLNNARQEYVITLEFLSELDASAIARQLGLQVKNVYSIKHKAMVRLRTKCADALRAELLLLLG